MKYGFFPGCTLEAAAEELMISTKKVAEGLGIELIELEGWTCCGASHSQDVDEFLSLCLNARNIALCEKLNAPLLSVCNTCTLMIRKAKKQLDEDDEIKEKVNEILNKADLNYAGTSTVSHLLWVLVKDYGIERLKKKVVRPLTGLKVANFYGCHILRPQEIMGFESFLNPDSMEMIVNAIGAENVYYDRRLSCCGFHAVFPAEDEVLKIAGLDCLSAKKAGAEVMVTPCPLCQMQLDMYQPDSQTLFKEDITMPILHLPQLIGLALGFEPKELGIKRHVIDAYKVLHNHI
ncbi:succinate dehydrogenase subunit C [Desulfonispora thiosulfatigenes DSM 11270]|uniref:Succinate dehydrogenase subunit C n=1 Tax=Desulfonispora thiosulfatigenes DSM 11270 TaxID=656914 RepID=A0A1W1V2R6_DESTI|nr:CoB--CoM heterodisulfide reductase iron-sulfur subunit B family protein [Desulfonispora thiosulfatigenes]SMB87623.1 succinate dehydrogenase subunit C [Desulfonispora thiosulfatigenes DSM 11270]